MVETPETVLAGDIGGTKTSLAIFSRESGLRKPLSEATYRSSNYEVFSDMVREFLSGTDIRISHACIGVAGPVFRGRTKVTNLPWVLDEAELERDLGFRSVRLMNDLLAFANSVPLLEGDDLSVISPGERDPEGAQAVIAPGTGLGEAYLTWDGTDFRAYPSEGGHSDFAPADRFQADLFGYLKDRMEHVSYEKVCSGIGIRNIYAFLKDGMGIDEPSWLAEELYLAADPVPVIFRHASDKGHPDGICQKTVSLFLSILGSAAGSMALHFMATGGVYLGGGIPPRILELLQNGEFMDAFKNKGKMSGLVSGIPVCVIRSPGAALRGAARCLMKEMRHGE